MALHIFSLPSVLSGKISSRVPPSTSTKAAVPLGGRRSANYQPSVWTYNDLRYLVADEARQSHRTVELQIEKAQMVEEVRGALNDENAEPMSMFTLIDDIQSLGLGRHFEEDILRDLRRCLSPDGVNTSLEKCLHGTALSFRILRQHGFHVSQDVFKIFMDESGHFAKTLGSDVQGLLNLYKACSLAFEEEDVLHDAKAFALEHLENLNCDISKYLQDHVNHELELPLHRRIPLLEARRSIEAYSRCGYANHRILELATTNFNMLQLILQRELQEMSGWWNDVSLAKKLSFARDRLMECFFWAVGMADEPSLTNCRKGLTKVISLITIIDDVYDVYGTLDELELFTDGVRRWDINAVEDLPGYMKLCFLALYNSVNEMAYSTLKETGENVIPYLTRAWHDLCKAFLQEAKWSYSKIVPGVEEYLNNGWVSSSGQVILTHAYFLSSPSLRKEELESLEHYHDLLRLPALIFRLTNDLATSSAELKRGETTNSILCYMQEKEVCESKAKEYVMEQIDMAWKTMNKYMVDHSIFNQSFVRMAYNLARMAHCVYQDGDAIGAPNDQSWNCVHSLIIKPISLVT
ncbi:hypothetical protein BT93_K1939 [Corymbia citriodora subsp. variegata]|nr:hypothetical protein BT93_K1939 [Corymbia citriodora subsp. variegata]